MNKKVTKNTKAEREQVLILGAGGLGKAIHEAFLSQGDFEVYGFLDDSRTGRFCRLPILGCLDAVEKVSRQHKVSNVILALGYHYQNRRTELAEKFSNSPPLKFVNAVHKEAKLANDVNLGCGIFLGINVVINAGTSIGDHTVVWTGAIIEHDNKIGKNVFIATGAITAGYVTIEDDVFVGMGAKIAKSKIGANATIGAGSLVLCDVDPSTYVKGIPAKCCAQKTEKSYLFSGKA